MNPAAPQGDHAETSTLVSLYVARRDLWPNLDSLIRQRGFDPDDATVFLQLAQLQGIGPFVRRRSAGDRATAQRELSRLAAVSLGRMNQLLGKFVRMGLFKRPLASRGSSPRQDRPFTAAGEKAVEELWGDYQWLAEKLLARASSADRAAHAAVCDHICRRTLPLEYLPPPYAIETWEPAMILHALLRAVRGLRMPLARMTLRDTGLSIEKADVLVILYLASEEAGGKPIFMPISQLRESLVHSLAESRFLLSRWLSQMSGTASGPVLVEGAPGAQRRRQVRITQAGIEVIRKVWTAYREFSHEILAGVPDKTLEAHRRVNRQISDLALAYR